MKQFDQSYAEQLFELREMLETHSLQHFLNLPDHDPAGCRRKPCSNVTGYCVTTSAIAFACSRNLTEIFTPYCFQLPTISFEQSLEIISVIFHFHYQWDESDLKQRNIIAVDEHMTILSALICRSDLDATLALRNHLNSAKQSMIRSINENMRYAH